MCTVWVYCVPIGWHCAWCVSSVLWLGCVLSSTLGASRTHTRWSSLYFGRHQHAFSLQVLKASPQVQQVFKAVFPVVKHPDSTVADSKANAGGSRSGIHLQLMQLLCDLQRHLSLQWALAASSKVIQIGAQEVFTLVLTQFSGWGTIWKARWTVERCCSVSALAARKSHLHIPKSTLMCIFL